MKKYMALGAVLAALGAGGAALGQTAAAGGAAAAQSERRPLGRCRRSSSTSAQPGPLATYTVANRSAAPTGGHGARRGRGCSRPSGKVSVNRRATLPGVSVEPALVHARRPGEAAHVDATLTAAPSAGALYGALEVVGLPADAATRKGVVLGYRLVGTIRVLPSTPTREPRGRHAEGDEGHRRDPGPQRRQHGRAGDGQRHAAAARAARATARSRRSGSCPASRSTSRSARAPARVLHGVAAAQPARQPGR